MPENEKNITAIDSIKNLIEDAAITNTFSYSTLEININGNLHKISRRVKKIHDACANTEDKPYIKLITIQDIIKQRSCCFIGTLLTQQDNPPQLMNEIEQALAPVIEGAKTEQRTALNNDLGVFFGIR